LIATSVIYAGTYDFACNWIGNEAWTRTLAKLEWSGQAEFGEQPLAEWVVDGKRAGRKRYTKGLTFATVGPHGTQILFEAPVRQAQGVAGDIWRCGSLDSRCELVSAISPSRHPTLGTVS
jgi:carboxypeptidase C (cathepsin A)